MTTRKTILFLIALVLLIVVIALQFASPRQASSVEMTEALAAKYDIPPFTVVKGDDLQLVSVPREGAGMVYTRTADLNGLLTTAEIRAGNAVRSEDVIQVPKNRVPDADTLVYSFYVPTARVIGGQLRPGHFVDLLATRADTREEGGASLWLARGLWVVGVKDIGGGEVLRPTVAVYNDSDATPRPGGLFGGETVLGQTEGPANLVMVATHREIAEMIGDYFGAQLYDAWVYIRPSGSGSGMGRIDGVVFEDGEQFGVQTRDELGIDQVSITLFDESGAAKATAQTSSGGKFHFDNLAPANYRVAVTVPDGYSPATPQDIAFYLADGQNKHLWFGERRPEPVVVVQQATPVPQATLAPAPTAQPQTTGREGVYALHMSNQEGGPEVIAFPSKVTEVWAVVAFRDVPADTAYTVRVQSTGAGKQERVASVGTWKGGSGTVSIRIAPWDGDEFADGAYITSLETGAEGTPRAFKSWLVGGEAVVGETRAQPRTGPDDPDTDSPLDSQR